MDLASIEVSYSHCIGVPSNFCFIKFLPKSTPEAPEPHRAPFWPPLRIRVRVEGVQPHYVTIRYIYYNIGFIKYPS